MPESSGRPLFETTRIFLDLPGGPMERAVEEMASRLAAAGEIRDADDVARRLVERERLSGTGLGGGLAIPHCKLPELDQVMLAIGLSRDGVDFHSLDGRPVRLIFLVLSPADSPTGHLQALARISRIVRSPGVTESVLSAGSADEISRVLAEADEKLAGA